MATSVIRCSRSVEPEAPVGIEPTNRRFAGFDRGLRPVGNLCDRRWHPVDIELTFAIRQDTMRGLAPLCTRKVT